MPSRLNPSTRDPTKGPHYWVTARGKHSVPTVTGGGKGERRGGKGPVAGGSGEGRPARGTTHTCWCPRPAELCAAGGLSPRMTWVELGGDTDRPVPRGPAHCTAIQSCFCPRLCFQLLPSFLGTPLPLALAPSALHPTSKILTLRPGESIPEGRTAQVCGLRGPEGGHHLHLASQLLESLCAPQAALQRPLDPRHQHRLSRGKTGAQENAWAPQHGGAGVSFRGC